MNKLPFLAGDALLLAAGAWLAFRGGPPLDGWHGGLVAACVALGAWLGVLPFLLEHRAAVELARADGLANTVEQIQNLRAVGEQIAAATASWSGVQESAGQVARTAREIADGIATEARQFTESLQKSQAAELRNLRLQVEKLHAAEGEWLGVVARMLDHVHALCGAARQSGQPGLIEQMSRFQEACRDAARRVGLTPVEADPGTRCDERLHQLPDGTAPAPGAEIEQMLATGLSYQGQLIRRVVVRLKSSPPGPASPPAA